MSTLGIALVTLGISLAAIFWLVVLDPREVGRSRRVRARDADLSMVPVRVPTELHRRPSVFQRIRAVVLMGGLTVTIGALLGVVVTLVGAAAALLLRSALG
jgi:hypothetical protein